MPYLGSEAFRDWIYNHRQTDDEDVAKAALSCLRPGLDDITSWVYEVFGVHKNSIAKLHAHMEEDNTLAKTVAKIKSGYDT